MGKRGDILSCSEQSEFGNTKVEFNLNVKQKDYITFQLFKSEFGSRFSETKVYEIYIGRCDEIKL